MTEQVFTCAPRAGACRQFLESMAQLNHVPSIFLLKLGRDWVAQPLPDDVPPGPIRQCYENAGALALERPELTYVEGYAYPPGLIPVHHAWCVDRQGRVIDNTLASAAHSEYFGVPVSRDHLYETVGQRKHWGILVEHMTARHLAACLEDVQAGAWPASEEAAAAMRELLRPLL